MTKTSPFNIISESKGGWGRERTRDNFEFLCRIQRNQKDKERERDSKICWEKK